MTEHLWNKYSILVAAIKHPEFEGIRVTPHVYVTLEEIDRLFDAMEDIITNGVRET
jgi:selenocysteine lyase/cysteine desulfurase